MNYTVKLASTVTLKKVDGQTVLFSKVTGDFYGLNPTAAYLLEELVQSDFESTSKKAAAGFGVEESQIQADLEEVIASLSEAKLVSIIPVAKVN